MNDRLSDFVCPVSPVPVSLCEFHRVCEFNSQEFSCCTGWLLGLMALVVDCLILERLVVPVVAALVRPSLSVIASGYRLQVTFLTQL